jgi:hypothetical protein
LVSTAARIRFGVDRPLDDFEGFGLRGKTQVIDDLLFLLTTIFARRLKKRRSSKLVAVAGNCR